MATTVSARAATAASRTMTGTAGSMIRLLTLKTRKNAVTPKRLHQV
ncbi:hypothetical protein [Nonomuraea jabiensis]